MYVPLCVPLAFCEIREIGELFEEVYELLRMPSSSEKGTN